MNFISFCLADLFQPHPMYWFLSPFFSSI